MKQNVNFMLAGLLAVSVVAMLLLTLYYKQTYDELNSRYDNSRRDILAAAEQLNKTIEDVKAKEDLLNRKEGVLNDYMSELNLSKERETSLGAHFVDLRNENDYLTDKLNKTMTDRERWLNLYNATKQQYDVCRWDYQLKEEEASKLQDRIDYVRNLKGPMLSSTAGIRKNGGDAGNNVDRISELADEIGSLSNESKVIKDANDIKSKADDINNMLDSILNSVSQLESSIDEMSKV